MTTLPVHLRVAPRGDGDGCAWVAVVLLNPPAFIREIGWPARPDPTELIRARVHALVWRHHRRDVEWVEAFRLGMDAHEEVNRLLAPPPMPRRNGASRGRTLEALMREHGSRCHWCQRPISRTRKGDDRATIEHLIPRSKNGTDDPANLRPACHWCNQSRGNSLGPPPTR